MKKIKTTANRYETHYSRLRELQAERKKMRAKMIAKIEAAQKEYRKYLEKYEKAREESEAQFYAAKKTKPETAETAVVEG